jgi:hypothetical protein
MVVPGFGGRTTRHPEELRVGTGADVVVVGGFVVVDAPDAAATGTAIAATSTLTEASPERAARRKRRARLS